MGESGFQFLSIALIAVALFVLSPRRYRHWAVLAFIFLAFIIVLIGLPFQLLFFVVAAILLWVASTIVQRNT